MDELERLIKATRDLRDLGATSVSVRVGGDGPSIDATFGPVVAPATEAAKEPTAAEIAAEREAILMHSAS